MPPGCQRFIIRLTRERNIWNKEIKSANLSPCAYVFQRSSYLAILRCFSVENHTCITDVACFCGIFLYQTLSSLRKLPVIQPCLIKTTVAREPLIEIIGLTKQSFNSNFHPVYHEGVTSCFCHSFYQEVLVVYLAATKDRELDSDVTTFTDFHRSLWWISSHFTGVTAVVNTNSSRFC